MKKKKLFSAAFSLAAGASLLTGLAACGNNNQASAPLTTEQLYALAQENGYEGTFDEWVALFKGDKGDKGDQGDKGAKGDQGVSGVGIRNVKVDEEGNLVITLTNGSEINAGKVASDSNDVTTGITTAKINEKGELVLTLSDNNEINCGVVVGATGAVGDKGEAGVGIKDVAFNTSGELIVTLTNNETINAGKFAVSSSGEVVVGAPGKDGVGIKNANINDKGELVITLTNDQTINAGKVVGESTNGKDGVGIKSAIVNDEGNLIITLTNDEAINAGKVIATTGGSDINGTGKDGVGIKSAVINSDGNLIITLTNYETINAGKVVGAAGETGATGLGIKSTTINVDGELVITLTDGTTLNAGKVVGSQGQTGQNGNDGVGIKGAALNDNGELVLTFTNDQTINVGKVVGTQGQTGQTGNDGVGVSLATVNEAGELIITLTNGTNVNAGKVVGAQGTNGVGIASASVNSKGELVIVMSDGSTINAGNVVGAQGQTGQTGVGIKSTTINTDGELVVTLTDGSTLNAGKVVGAQGQTGQTGNDGIGIKNVTINDKFELVITLSNDEVKNLGSVKGENGSDGNDGVGVDTASINEEGKLVIKLSNGNEIELGTVVGKDYVKATYTVELVDEFNEYEPLTVTEGNTLPLETPEVKGYEFIGWFTENNTLVTEINGIFSDLTLYAKYEKIEKLCTVTINGVKYTASPNTKIKDLYNLDYAYLYYISYSARISNYAAVNINEPISQYDGMTLYYNNEAYDSENEYYYDYRYYNLQDDMEEYCISTLALRMLGTKYMDDNSYAYYTLLSALNACYRNISLSSGNSSNDFSRMDYNYIGYMLSNMEDEIEDMYRSSLICRYVELSIPSPDEMYEKLFAIIDKYADIISPALTRIIYNRFISNQCYFADECLERALNVFNVYYQIDCENQVRDEDIRCLTLLSTAISSSEFSVREALLCAQMIENYEDDLECAELLHLSDEAIELIKENITNYDYYMENFYYTEDTRMFVIRSVYETIVSNLDIDYQTFYSFDYALDTIYDISYMSFYFMTTMGGSKMPYNLSELVNAFAEKITLIYNNRYAYGDDDSLEGPSSGGVIIKRHAAMRDNPYMIHSFMNYFINSFMEYYSYYAMELSEEIGIDLSNPTENDLKLLEFLHKNNCDEFALLECAINHNNPDDIFSKFEGYFMYYNIGLYFDLYDSNSYKLVGLPEAKEGETQVTYDTVYVYDEKNDVYLEYTNNNGVYRCSGLVSNAMDYSCPLVTRDFKKCLLIFDKKPILAAVDTTKEYTFIPTKDNYELYSNSKYMIAIYNADYDLYVTYTVEDKTTTENEVTSYKLVYKYNSIITKNELNENYLFPVLDKYDIKGFTNYALSQVVYSKDNEYDGSVVDTVIVKYDTYVVDFSVNTNSEGVTILNYMVFDYYYFDNMCSIASASFITGIINEKGELVLTLSEAEDAILSKAKEYSEITFTSTDGSNCLYVYDKKLGVYFSFIYEASQEANSGVYNYKYSGYSYNKDMLYAQQAVEAKLDSENNKLTTFWDEIDVKLTSEDEATPYIYFKYSVGCYPYYKRNAEGAYEFYGASSYLDPQMTLVDVDLKTNTFTVLKLAKYAELMNTFDGVYEIEGAVSDYVYFEYEYEYETIYVRLEKQNEGTGYEFCSVDKYGSSYSYDLCKIDKDGKITLVGLSIRSINKLIEDKDGALTLSFDGDCDKICFRANAFNVNPEFENSYLLYELNDGKYYSYGRGEANGCVGSIDLENKTLTVVKHCNNCLKEQYKDVTIAGDYDNYVAIKVYDDAYVVFEHDSESDSYIYDCIDSSFDGCLASLVDGTYVISHTDDCKEEQKFVEITIDKDKCDEVAIKTSNDKYAVYTLNSEKTEYEFNRIIDEFDGCLASLVDGEYKITHSSLCTLKELTLDGDNCSEVGLQVQANKYYVYELNTTNKYVYKETVTSYSGCTISYVNETATYVIEHSEANYYSHVYKNLEFANVVHNYVCIYDEVKNTYVLLERDSSTNKFNYSYSSNTDCSETASLFNKKSDGTFELARYNNIEDEYQAKFANATFATGTIVDNMSDFIVSIDNKYIRCSYSNNKVVVSGDVTTTFATVNKTQYVVATFANDVFTVTHYALDHYDVALTPTDTYDDKHSYLSVYVEGIGYLQYRYSTTDEKYTYFNYSTDKYYENCLATIDLQEKTITISKHNAYDYLSNNNSVAADEDVTCNAVYFINEGGRAILFHKITDGTYECLSTGLNDNQASIYCEVAYDYENNKLISKENQTHSVYCSVGKLTAQSTATLLTKDDNVCIKYTDNNYYKLNYESGKWFIEGTKVDYTSTTYTLCTYDEKDGYLNIKTSSDAFVDKLKDLKFSVTESQMPEDINYLPRWFAVKYSDIYYMVFRLDTTSKVYKYCTYTNQDAYVLPMISGTTVTFDTELLTDISYLRGLNFSLAENDIHDINGPYNNSIVLKYNNKYYTLDKSNNTYILYSTASVNKSIVSDWYCEVAFDGTKDDNGNYILSHIGKYGYYCTGMNYVNSRNSIGDYYDDTLTGGAEATYEVYGVLYSKNSGLNYNVYYKITKTGKNTYSFVVVSENEATTTNSVTVKIFKDDNGHLIISQLS